MHGLVALMEIQSSRTAARTDADGVPVLLLEQDRSRWDQLLIRRGLAALERAESLGRPPGPYVLQAGIAACHARARTADETDWARIAALYERLAVLDRLGRRRAQPGCRPVDVRGPGGRARARDQLLGVPALAGYHLLPERPRRPAGQARPYVDEARAEFERAADLTQNERNARCCSHGPRLG